MSLEDRNYYNDPRVRAASHSSGLVFDENAMTLTWTRTQVVEEDGQEIEKDIDVVFHAEFGVCDTCGGKGKHVNPSIDSGGICQDDEFWEDDCDEDTGESRYFRGDYDVPCYECDGRRVSPFVIVETPETADALAEYQDYLREEAAYERERAAERDMGA
jgi:hypothetical protein